MINSLLLKLATAQLPKIIRHLLVFIGTFFATHAVSGNVNAPVELITGVLLTGIGYLWSVTVKTPVDSTWFEILRNAAEVAARKLITAWTAYLAAHGAPTTGDLTTEAMLIATANYIVSALTRSDPKK